jgi:hypothetical protein
MQELKPAAWMRSEIEKADCPFGYYGPVKCYPDDVPLYALPATHRIVPVALLELLEGVLSRSEYRSHNELSDHLTAIIDKEK